MRFCSDRFLFATPMTVGISPAAAVEYPSVSKVVDLDILAIARIGLMRNAAPASGRLVSCNRNPRFAYGQPRRMRIQRDSERELPKRRASLDVPVVGGSNKQQLKGDTGVSRDTLNKRQREDEARNTKKKHIKTNADPSAAMLADGLGL
jgi:hypothetical protein